mmetsp:Transcript_8158/g.24427  ORF Transcript_8158/g.24427 Transcript_8158/m.24427 type:complete len:399 (-) Transcript_8158:156-1352(-)
MVQERRVLRRVQQLQQGRGRVPARAAAPAQLVHLVDEDDRVRDLRRLEALHGLARHGAHVRPPVALDLRDVAEAAHGEAVEGAAERRRHGPAHARLARARRPHEAEDLAPHAAHERAHGAHGEGAQHERARARRPRPQRALGRRQHVALDPAAAARGRAVRGIRAHLALEGLAAAPAVLAAQLVAVLAGEIGRALGRAAARDGPRVDAVAQLGQRLELRRRERRARHWRREPLREPARDGQSIVDVAVRRAHGVAHHRVRDRTEELVRQRGQLVVLGGEGGRGVRQHGGPEALLFPFALVGRLKVVRVRLLLVGGQDAPGGARLVRPPRVFYDFARHVPAVHFDFFGRGALEAPAAARARRDGPEIFWRLELLCVVQPAPGAPSAQHESRWSGRALGG